MSPLQSAPILTFPETMDYMRELIKENYNLKRAIGLRDTLLEIAETHSLAEVAE